LSTSHPAAAALRWQMVCLIGLVVAVPLTWLGTTEAWASPMAMVAWPVAIAAYIMGWRAILSARRLTLAQRRAILLQISTQQLRRLELSTRILFVATGTFAIFGILVIVAGGRHQIG
jgi:hypothetical protein